MKTCSDEKQRFFTTAATAATLAPGRDRLDLLPSSLSSQSSSGSFLGSSSSGGGGMWQQTAHSPHTSTVAVVAKANARLCCCRDEEQAKLHPAATYCAEITKRYLEEDQDDDDDDEDDEAQLSTPIIYDMLRDLNILNREYENILSDEPDHMHSLSFSSTRRHHHHHQQQHVNDVNAHQMLQCDVPFYSVLDEHQGGEVRCCNGGDDVVDDDGPFAPFDTSDDLLGAYDASSHIASPPTDALGAAPEVFGGCRKRKDEPDGGGGCSSTPSLLDAAAAATLHPLSISHVLSQSIQNIADSSSCIIDYNNNNSSSRSMLGGRVEVQNRRYSQATTARCMACMLGDESDLRFDTARSCCQGLERGNHSDVARCAVIGQTRRAHTLGAIGSESQLFGASSPSNIQVSDCENQRLDLTKSRQKLPLSHHKYHLPSSSFHNPLPSFRASVPNYYESPHRTYETTSVNNSSANCSALKSSDQSKSKSSRHHNHHHHHHHPHQNNNQPQHHQTNHRNSSKKYAAINCDPAAKHNQIYHQRSEQNCGASSRKNSQMSSANAGSNSSSGSNGAGGGGSQKLYSFCTFCKNNGESEAIYGTHYLKDIGGVVTCPILRAYTCPICGQSGDRAHTVKYCPFMSQLAAAASKTTLKPAGASSESNNQIFSSIAADGSPASHNNHNAGSAANANNAFIGDSATALLTGGGGSGVALSMPFRSEMRVLRTARTSAGKRRFL